MENERREHQHKKNRMYRTKTKLKKCQQINMNALTQIQLNERKNGRSSRVGFGQTHNFVIVNKFWIKADTFLFAFVCWFVIVFIPSFTYFALAQTQTPTRTQTHWHACIHTNTPSSRAWTLVVLTHLNDFTSFRDSFSLLVSILLFFSLLLLLYLSFFSFSSMLRFIQSFDRSSWE